jgi:hypothetical protein
LATARCSTSGFKIPYNLQYITRLFARANPAPLVGASFAACGVSATSLTLKIDACAAALMLIECRQIDTPKHFQSTVFVSKTVALQMFLFAIFETSWINSLKKPFRSA